jgi:hypothetical protein
MVYVWDGLDGESWEVSEFDDGNIEGGAVEDGWRERCR